MISTPKALTIPCSCLHTSHQVNVYYDGDGEEYWFSVEPIKAAFWHRLVTGIKYIFNIDTMCQYEGVLPFKDLKPLYTELMRLAYERE